MKRLKILLATMLMLVAVITVTGVSLAAWVYSENTQLDIDISAGAWEDKDTNSDNLEYEELFDEVGHISAYKVTGFKKDMVGTIVRIPSVHNTLPVVAIASSFCNDDMAKFTLNKLIIPASVITIEDDSFTYLEMLSVVVIEGESLTTIGDRVFSNCFSLSDIELPSSITNIGADVLTYCDNLSSINVLAQKSKINVANKGEIINFGLKTDGSYPTITFAKEAA